MIVARMERSAIGVARSVGTTPDYAIAQTRYSSIRATRKITGGDDDASRSSRGRNPFVQYLPRGPGAAGAENLQHGQAETARRQADRRGHGLLAGSQHVLRDGQRRIRLSVDRDAAQPARLPGRRAHDLRL